MKIKFLFFTSLIFSISFAQSKGTIKGTLTDKDANNIPLAYANAIIKGTTVGVTTDESGQFFIAITPGDYIIQFSYVGYENLEIPVTVKSGETVIINKALGSGGYKLEDVVVQSVKKRNTETAIMLEIKEAKQVVSAISAEQMSKGTDGNAAQAIQRVPGITIVDGKFVMIRGLSERYNNVLINGAIAPSTEVDKRTFSFDLVPTNLLDKMVIYKTGSADKPGDFSGGIIGLTTAENTTEFTKIDLNFGYRTGTTFNEYLQSEGSDTDFVGVDNNFRPLPSSFPTTFQMQDSPRSSLLRADAAHSLKNNFTTNTNKDAFFDTGMGFSLGRKINFGSMKLYTVNALSYATNYQSYQRQFNRYFSLNAGQERPQNWLDYKDDVYQQEVRISFLSNWILKISDRSKIKFKNLFNQIGENETTIRNGFNFQQRGNDNLRNYSLGYRSRSIYMGQLNGEHKLNTKHEFDWVIGYNYVQEKEPDLRRFRTYQAGGDPNEPYRIIDPPSSNLFDTSRYFGNLREFNATNGVNYTYTLNRDTQDEEFVPIKFKIGYLADYKFRIFKSRYLSYLLPGYVPQIRQDELITLPLDQVFNNANVNNVDGWVLEEGTRPVDSYKSDNTLIAGFIAAEIPLGKFDINAGVRIENNTLSLRAFDARPISIDKPITSVLPSLNIGYNLSEKALLRVAYSRTVNRPEFREIAPFLYYDFEYDVAKYGNPDLETATIDNFDFRFEWYPSKGETVSLGGFYKNFDKPIENITQITTEQPQFTIANAESAYNYGVELEVKKSFKNVFDNPFLSRLSTNLNASYIVSEVNLGNQASSQDQKRALQGQSPYIINASLGYEDEKGFSVNAFYNRFGNRIFSVGDTVFPTIYEIGRDNLDITIAKKINKLKIKLGAQNVINAPYKLMEDSNRDFKIKNANDNNISVFRRGVLFSLGLSYNL